MFTNGLQIANDIVFFLFTVFGLLVLPLRGEVKLELGTEGNNNSFCPGEAIDLTCSTNTGVLIWVEDNRDLFLYNSHKQINDTFNGPHCTFRLTDRQGESMYTSRATCQNFSSDETDAYSIHCNDGSEDTKTVTITITGRCI